MCDKDKEKSLILQVVAFAPFSQDVVFLGADGGYTVADVCFADAELPVAAASVSCGVL